MLTEVLQFCGNQLGNILNTKYPPIIRAALFIITFALYMAVFAGICFGIFLLVKGGISLFAVERATQSFLSVIIMFLLFVLVCLTLWVEAYDDLAPGEKNDKQKG